MTNYKRSSLSVWRCKITIQFFFIAIFLLSYRGGFESRFFLTIILYNMKTLVHFKKLKETLSGIQFYTHCKRMLFEKENYSKIAIQKAQQFMDDYTTPNKFYLT